jgi:hypothetical protein
VPTAPPLPESPPVPCAPPVPDGVEPFDEHPPITIVSAANPKTEYRVPDMENSLLAEVEAWPRGDTVGDGAT